MLEVVACIIKKLQILYSEGLGRVGLGLFLVLLIRDVEQQLVHLALTQVTLVQVQASLPRAKCLFKTLHTFLFFVFFVFAFVMHFIYLINGIPAIQSSHQICGDNTHGTGVTTPLYGGEGEGKLLKTSCV